MKLYMKVTQDKYSLPLDIDTSPTELAKRWGEPRQTLFMQIWRQKKRRDEKVSEICVCGG